LARATDQRDILKKAASILSETPSSGMPGSFVQKTEVARPPFPMMAG
jgi:hypothetical protein